MILALTIRWKPLSCYTVIYDTCIPHTVRYLLLLSVVPFITVVSKSSVKQGRRGILRTASFLYQTNARSHPTKCLSIVILRLFFYRIRKFCHSFVVCTFHVAIGGCSELIIMPAYICLGKSLVYQVKDLPDN